MCFAATSKFTVILGDCCVISAIKKATIGSDLYLIFPRQKLGWDDNPQTTEQGITFLSRELDVSEKPPTLRTSLFQQTWVSHPILIMGIQCIRVTLLAAVVRVP